MVVKKRVNIYVDGFNFYFGLRAKGWRKYYWLDVVKFFEAFMKPDQELQSVCYYSAVTAHPHKKKRQERFFRANRQNPKFHLVLGQYLEKELTCQCCRSKFSTWEEKQTDVNIAVDMLKDVVANACDVSILVSADSDLLPPIKAIRALKPQHPVAVFFPPCRKSFDIANTVSTYLLLEHYERRFMRNLLPNEVASPCGCIIHKPQKWS